MNNFDDWTQELSQFLEGTAKKTEQWAEQTLQQAADAADTLTHELESHLGPTLEQWADEWYQALAPIETALDEEVERLSEEFTEFVTPLVTPVADAMEAWVAAITDPLNKTLDPLVNDHNACVGCRHYYGQAHGGNMLVCAMYPYGPDQEKCPDWESAWEHQSSSSE